MRHSVSALLLTVIVCTQSVCAILVGGAVLPHGDFAYDPSLVHNANGSLAVHKGALAVAKMVRDAQPDLMVMITPHGLALENALLVYENSLANGSATIGGDLHNKSAGTYEVGLSAALSATAAKAVSTALQSAGHRVTGMQGFADSLPLPIHWGEVIPFSFLQHQPSLKDVPSVILSLPLRRYNSTTAMIGEYRALGVTLGGHLSERPDRVVVVVSTDLAHTHQASGPYGYSPTAEPFDEACGEWAASGDASPLVGVAGALVDKALSCGYLGMVALQGAMDGNGWGCHRHGLAHPTYYGMLSAWCTPSS